MKRHTVYCKVHDLGTNTHIDGCIYVDAPDAETAKKMAEDQFFNVHGRQPYYQSHQVLSQYPIPQLQAA